MSIRFLSRSAQAWYMDFAIALLLFTFTLVVYYGYTNNFQKQDKGGLDELITDAKSISSSLALPGYPLNWDNTTVLRIGIADDQAINSTKVKKFKQYGYNASKRRFGTQNDFIVFFIDGNGQVINIKSVCVIGYPAINSSYNTRSAYYYQDENDDFLKNFMNNTLKADIYFNDQSNDIYGLQGLMSNISKYGLVVLEHPVLSGGDYNEYYRELNNFTASGGFLLISGELTTSNGRDLSGIEFWKKSGQSQTQRTAIVNNTDTYLNLKIGDSMVFNQYYYATNTTSLSIESNPQEDDYNPYPAANFLRIATFNQTDDNAVTKWKYGNGTVYFFSDFDVSFFNGDFASMVGDALSGFIGGICTPINVSTAINPKKLVKTERYLTYNSKVARMEVYVWQ
ncbi:hypothetical protein HYV80_05145 [Candidatus Woesearchaeota archaeon]|nr:hypothetical protein [Candidatus Woesearchaeota archaeon]